MDDYNLDTLDQPRGAPPMATNPLARAVQLQNDPHDPGMPDWPAVENQFRQQYPDVPVERLRMRYEQERLRRRAASEVAAQLDRESTVGRTVGQALPFLSTAHSFAGNVMFGRAQHRVEEGTASLEDHRIVQEHEIRQQTRENQSLGMDIAEAGAQGSAIFGEAAMGGAVLGAVAAPSVTSAPNMLSRSAFTSLGMRGLGGAALKTAAQTAVMPSMWAPQWTENNIQNGRDPLDVRGMPAALTMGFMNTAILGSLGGAGNAITTKGVKGVAARILTRTATGMLEQQAVDTLSSAISEVLPEAYRLNTGYGLVGHLLNKGADKQFWRHGLTQALTFAAFSVMHEGQTPHEAVGALGDYMNAAHEAGMTPEQASSALVEMSRAAGMEPGTAQPPTPQANALEFRQNSRQAQVRAAIEKVTRENPTASPGRLNFLIKQAIGEIPAEAAQQPLALEGPPPPAVAEAQRMTEGIPEGTLPPDQVQSSFGHLEGIRTAPEAQPGPETPVQTQTPVQAQPEAVAGQPERLSGTNPRMRELLDRSIAGEDITREDVQKASKMSNREADVFYDVAVNRRTLDAIGSDTGVTKQAVSPVWQRAYKKAGLTPEAAKEMLARIEEANKQARQIADEGKAIDFVPDEGTHRAVSNAAEELGRIDREMETLSNQYLQEASRAKPNRKKIEAITNRIAELDSQYKERYSASETKPGEVSGGESTPEEAQVNQRAAGSLRDLAAEVWKDDAGSIRDPLDFIEKGVAEAKDFFGKLGGVMFPKMQRQSLDVTDAAARLAATGVHLDALIPHLERTVMGDLPADKKSWAGATINELRLRWAKYAMAQEAQQFISDSWRQPDQKLAKEMRKNAFRLQVQSKQVGTLIGGTELPTEAAFRQSVNDPQLKGVMSRWQKFVSPVLDAYYRKSQGIPENDPINNFTQIPGFTFSMVKQAEGDTSGKVVRGDLRNPKARKLGASNAFTGAGDYETDLGRILDQSMRSRVKTANKAEFYRTLVSEGAGLWDTNGARHEGYTRFEDVSPPWGTQEATRDQKALFVKNEIAPEVRQLLQADEPFTWAGKPFASGITKMSLASFVEMTSHSSNLLKSSFVTLASGQNPLRFFKNAWDVYKQRPEAVQKLIDLAEIGANKSHGLETPQFKVLKMASNLLDVVNDGMRITLADAFDAKTKSGAWEATESNKRDFINQNLGQYNRAAQNKFVVLMRDLGLAPFATAGTTFNMQGVRSLLSPLMGPGVRTTSYAEAIKLRVAYAGTLASVFAAVAGINAMKWGNPLGDDNTPFGAIKLGTDAQGKTAYLDLGSITGVTRGARITGLLAAIEGTRYGAGGADIAKRAGTDVLGGAIHPFQGPAVQAAYIAGFGEAPGGHQVQQRPDHGDYDIVRNVLSAALNANPLLAQLRGRHIPFTEDSRFLGTRADIERSQAGNLGENLAPLVGTTPLGRIGFRDAPPGQPQRNYAVRGPEVDRLNDMISNLNRRRTETIQQGKEFEQQSELRILERAAGNINRLESALRGGRQQKQLAPHLRDPRDTEMEREIRQMQSEIAQDALQMFAQP